jgi:hypothetical protein
LSSEHGKSFVRSLAGLVALSEPIKSFPNAFASHLSNVFASKASVQLEFLKTSSASASLIAAHNSVQTCNIDEGIFASFFLFLSKLVKKNSLLRQRSRAGCLTARKNVSSFPLRHPVGRFRLQAAGK